MTSIMWPTRSRVSQPVQRVMTFQFFGSETRRVKLARARRMTLMTVSLPSADIGLTGAIVAVLICSLSSRGQTSRPPKTVSVSCAPRRGGRDDDGRQVELQVLAPPFVLRRQLERRAERFGGLVDREAWLVGGDLEQDPARLAEINRSEVFALDHWCHVAPGLDQHLAPVNLMRIVRGAPRNMVDGSGRLLSHRRFRRVEHVEHRARAAGAGLESGAVVFGAHLAKAHCVGQELDGVEVGLFAQGHGVEAANLVVRIDRAVRPRLPPLIRRLTHELDLDGVGILEDQRIDAETGHPRGFHVEVTKTAGPELQRAGRDRERDHGHLPAARAPPGQVRPPEEGHRASWRAEVIAEIDVVGVGHVEVDGLLYEAETQHADVKVDVLLHVTRDARHVVDSGNVGGHRIASYPAGQTSEPMLVRTRTTWPPHYRSRLCSEASSSARLQISAAMGSLTSSWRWATRPIARAITASPRPTCQGNSSSQRIAPMAPVALTGSSRP